MTAALVRRLADSTSLRVAGADRTAFLHRLLTADIAGLESDTSRPCMLLDTKGRVQALMEIVATPDAVVGFAHQDAVALVVTTLERYVLGADVAFTPQELAVVGLRGEVGPLLDAADLPGAGVVARRGDEAFIATSDPESVVAALIAAGATEADDTAWLADRIAAGQPGHGAEVSGREFPQELGLVDAVDFDKGCYLGQETVARIHYRGQVNRLLAVLRSTAPLTSGTELQRDGAAVGTISSAAERSGEWLGLALLPRDAAAPGTTLSGPESTMVEVIDNVETHPNATTTPPAS